MKNIRDFLKNALEGKRYWLYVAVVFILSRIPTWLFPFDSDHWIFYYVGREWLDGKVLYLQVWDHKSPLIFAINSGIHAVFGGNIVLHRILFTAVTAAATWVFYLAAIRLFVVFKRRKPKLDARVATLLFAFFANLSQFTNSANSTENFGILTLMLAVYAYLRWREQRLVKWLLYSGFAISLTVFLKINFSLLLIPLIIDFIALHRGLWSRFFINSAVWIAPLIAQVILWFSYFQPRGLLNEFWVATIEFNGKYLRAGWAGNLSGQLVFVAILSASLLFFVGPFYFMLRKRKSEHQLLFILGLTTVLFGGILGTFYSHYYLIAVPYLCLVAGAYWREIYESKGFRLLSMVALILAFGISVKQLYNRFVGPTATDAENMTSAALYVKEHTSPSDTIVFYGYGATFYRLSERDSGTRFISASHTLIDEREGFGYGFTDKFIGDAAVSKPKYWIVDEATQQLYDDNVMIWRYFKNHYTLETDLEGYQVWKIRK